MVSWPRLNSSLNETGDEVSYIQRILPRFQVPTVFRLRRQPTKLLKVVRKKLSASTDESRSVRTLGRERTPEAIVRPLWNWTRHVQHRSDSATPDAGRTGVRILLISCDEAYRARWQRIFDSLGWGFECVLTIEDALNTLCRCTVPVVVYDSQAAGEART